MDRRDFLLLRHPMSPRTVEMSCERLHMSYLDLQAAADPSPVSIDGPAFAEPPATLPQRNVEEWLRDLEAQLSDADVIRVAGVEWLRPDALRDRVDAILRGLERRGIRIERVI